MDRFLQIIVCFFSMPLWGLTTSVIIPCAAQHFPYLEPLIERYAAQSVLPDEIVISLSQVEKLAAGNIDALESRNWPFKLSILRHWEKKSAGMNRNLACKMAQGDLIICQDADDIPHPQRVEIIKHLFEKFSIAHLLHTYFYDKKEKAFVPYQVEDLQPRQFHRYDDLEKIYQDRLHNGNIAFLRFISRMIKWDDVFECDHDVKFNQQVYAINRNCAAIDADLILYRQQLSAFNQENIPWKE